MARELSIESLSAGAQQCPPDVEEIAEGCCMETLERTARIAFEEHYLACPRCASIATSTNEYIRSMKAALRRLRPGGLSPIDTFRRLTGVLPRRAPLYSPSAKMIPVMGGKALSPSARR